MKCCSERHQDHTLTGTPQAHVKNAPCLRNCERCAKKKEKQKSSAAKKAVALVSTLALTIGTAGAQQTETAPTFWDDPFNSPLLPLIVVASFVIVTMVLVLVVSIFALRVINLLVAQMEKAKAESKGLVYVAKPSWWETFWQQANASVPVAKEKDIDLGHNFDGIRELDNHLPPWWKGLFYGSIVWGGIYLFLYHVVPTLPLSQAEYENELTMAEEQARKLRALQPAEVIDENALTFTKDAVIIQKGKAVFTSNNCQSCHRVDGGGNAIGPNLTDVYWIHGGEIKNVFSTIKTGVVEKGMPAWGKVMSAADVRNVAFYVMSLQGSNPRDAKAPQGQPYEPVVAADSTVVQPK